MHAETRFSSRLFQFRWTSQNDVITINCDKIKEKKWNKEKNEEVAATTKPIALPRKNPIKIIELKREERIYTHTHTHETHVYNWHG